MFLRIPRKSPTMMGIDPMTAMAAASAIAEFTKPGSKTNKTVIFRDAEDTSMLPEWLPWAAVGGAGLLAFALLK